MACIFISYRRDDSSAYAGRIYDRLVSHFGESNVFMDVDGLKPGDDFIDVLQKTVGSCDVLIAVIGRNWLSMQDQAGHKRLTDPEDFVRLEIGTALERGIRVIPALVGGALMPKTEELPDSLAKLARRQAIVLTDMNFGDGIGRLMQAIDLPTHGTESHNPAPAKSRKNVFRALAAGLVLLAAAGTYFTWRTHFKKDAVNLPPATDPSGTLSLADLKNAYRIPKNLDGGGQTIGMIELDGGYLDSDIQKYFADAHLAGPKIFTKSVDGAVNKPGSDSDSSVTLGIEVAGGIAPAAQLVVYFAKNTSASFVHAIEAASNDTVHHPSVLLIAWGQPEEGWSLADRTDLNYALGTAAVQKRITVVTAAGDNGPTDGMKDGKLHVDFPASSPFVLAVGGTQLRAPFSREGTQGEDFLSGPGRGTSSMFFKPDWQQDLPGTRRAIPDVAADATSRYQVILHGEKTLIGGTSASATLWAGLLALVAQKRGGGQGVINPFLYQTLGPRKTLRAIPSDTAECKTIKGWNTCSGWGSPDGEKLVAAFQ